MGKHLDTAIKLLTIKHKESSVQNHVFTAQMRPSKSSQGHTKYKHEKGCTSIILGKQIEQE